MVRCLARYPVEERHEQSEPFAGGDKEDGYEFDVLQDSLDV